METLVSLLEYSKRIAFGMSKDPEMGSIAGIALWRALLSYDVDRNVPLKAWIAKCVKQHVHGYWKEIQKRRELLMSDEWWATVSENVKEEQLNISQEDWQLLVEEYILKWPVDVIARRRGVSVYRIRKELAAAVARIHNEN